jgi:hypothetical protein
MKKTIAIAALVLTAGCTPYFYCPTDYWDTGYGTCCPDSYPFYYAGQCWSIAADKTGQAPADAKSADAVKATESK